MNIEQNEFGDMSAEDFKKFGYEMVDRIAEYFAHIEELPVLSQIKPGSLKDNLPKVPPATGEDFALVAADVDELILPAVTNWNHPNFHGLFSTSSSSVAIFAEMLSAAFDQKAMLWRTSPASTELEEVVLDWLRQMMNLPADFNGIIYDTASVSTMHAIAVARERLGLRIREDGMSGREELPLLRLYCSDQTHTSIDKAAITLGLGQRSVRKIESDEFFRIIPHELERAIKEDIAAGYKPFCVIGTIGTTSTSSVDDINALGNICKKHQLWLHVDAAYAGSAMILAENQHHLKGIEKADSYVTNPHKWFFTPFDLSALFIKDIDLLKQTFALVPEYLKVSETVTNQMDYGIQLGRRFRALKLWFVMRYFGQEGLRARIREHIRLAHLFATWAEDSPIFEVMAPIPFALVCFRAIPEGCENLDEFNEELMNEINADGEAYLSQTKLNGRFALRLSIGSIHVQEKHIRKIWKLLEAKVAEKCS